MYGVTGVRGEIFHREVDENSNFTILHLPAIVEWLYSLVEVLVSLGLPLSRGVDSYHSRFITRECEKYTAVTKIWKWVTFPPSSYRCVPSLQWWRHQQLFVSAGASASASTSTVARHSPHPDFFLSSSCQFGYCSSGENDVLRNILQHFSRYVLHHVLFTSVTRQIMVRDYHRKWSIIRVTMLNVCVCVYVIDRYILLGFHITFQEFTYVDR